jgi:hypothetical protein
MPPLLLLQVALVGAPFLWLLLPATPTEAAAAAASPQSRDYHSCWRRLRAGGQDADTLDAYIDNLLSSVDDDGKEVSGDDSETVADEEEESIVASDSNDDELSVETDDDDEEESNEEEVELDDVADVPQEKTTTGKVKRKGGPSRNERDREDTETDSASKIDGREAIDRKLADTSSVELAEKSIDKAKNPRDATQEQQQQQNDTNPDRPSDPRPAAASAVALRRQPPPNSLYRFLLNRGRTGRAIVMGLVVFIEWLTLYVPTVGNILNALGSRLFPPAAPQRTDRQRRTRASKRVLTRQADEIALVQLKRIGKDAKYRRVSLDFMKRHRLGPYSSYDELHLEKVDEKAIKPPRDIVSSSTVNRATEKMIHHKMEVEIDWVVEALTKPRRRSIPQSSLAMDEGSGGPSVSIGLKIRTDQESRRRSIIDAIVADARKRRARKAAAARSAPATAAPSRQSERDNGSILGRLRAAAGTDSLLSRSLLGAYPGDAVPPSEAANARGVIDLARRYGYGEWSSDTEVDVDGDDLQSPSPRDEDNVGVSRKRRKVRRRTGRQPRQDSKELSSENDGFGDIGFLNDSLVEAFDSHDSSGRRPLPTKSTHFGVTTALNVGSSDKGHIPKPIRPVLEEINESRKRSQHGASFSSELPSIKRRESAVRPALESLDERKEKLMSSAASLNNQLSAHRRPAVARPALAALSNRRAKLEADDTKSMPTSKRNVGQLHSALAGISERQRKLKATKDEGEG